MDNELTLLLDVDNQLTLLCLDDEQVRLLNSIGRTDLTSLNNTPVTNDIKCTALAELSRFGTTSLGTIHFTFEERDLLKESDRSYYVGFLGKTVGEKLFSEIKSYIWELRKKQQEKEADNGVEC